LPAENPNDGDRRCTEDLLSQDGQELRQPHDHV